MNRRRILLTVVLMIGAGVLMIPRLQREPVADGQTISQWLEILGDGYSDQSEIAAAAIQKIGTNALPWMLREIKRENSTAKLWIQEQAERQSWIKFKFEDEDKHREHAEAAFEILGETAAPAIPALMKLMVKDEVPYEVREALVHIGEPAVVPLVQALTSPNPALRQNAAEALYLHNPTPPLAVPALLDCLTDVDAGVRATAAKALNGPISKAEQIVPALIALLNDTNEDVRLEAARSLQYFGDKAEKAVEPLLIALADERTGIQSQAAVTLGQIARRSDLVVPALLTQINQADEWLGMSVIESLQHFPDKADDIVPALLKHSEIDHRYETVHAIIGTLGGIKSRPDLVLPYLASSLENPNPYVRWDAVWALRNFGDSSEQTISALKRRLNDNKDFYHGWRKSHFNVSAAASEVLQILQTNQVRHAAN